MKEAEEEKSISSLSAVPFVEFSQSVIRASNKWLCSKFCFRHSCEILKRSISGANRRKESGSLEKFRFLCTVYIELGTLKLPCVEGVNHPRTVS